MPRTSLESAGRAEHATGYSRAIKASERGGAPHTHTHTPKKKKEVHLRPSSSAVRKAVRHNKRASWGDAVLCGARRADAFRSGAAAGTASATRGCCSPSSALNNGSRRRHRVWVPLVPPAFGPLPASRRRRRKKQSWLANRPTLGFGSCKQIALPQRRQWAF